MADFWGNPQWSDHLRYRQAASAQGQPPWIGSGMTEEEYNALSPEEQRAVRDRRDEQTHRRAISYMEGGPGPGGYSWTDLETDMPSISDLSVEYGQEAEVGDWDPSSGVAGAYADPSSITAQYQALEDMQRLARDGGWSAGDRARQELGRQQIGAQMRASREADEAALQARGMGGSGMQLASLMGTQQAGATALSQRDAQLEAAASDRALQALSNYGSMASGIRDQSYGEEVGRRSAIDEYNASRAAYLRDRERFNTQQRDRSAESRAGAQQTYFGNRATTAAGREGRADATIATQQAAQDRTDRLVGAGLQLGGSLFG